MIEIIGRKVQIEPFMLTQCLNFMGVIKFVSS